MNVNEINEQIQRHIAFSFDYFICFFLNTVYSDCSEFEYEAITGMSGLCYKAFTDLKSYSETQSMCKNDGGNLVRIPTSTKHAAILQVMNLKSSKLRET